ncbi:hypothetical protein JMJ35_008126 [Cladonia borealis]|uniref:C2H2-type domain-containing protein n=1 Tax=Cladonia borealis TaxID=184061 RepID=A0AA39QUZ7_9LECA|nr:hypothetical protein JMJ35_008126 [Cladonia borealis]
MPFSFPFLQGQRQSKNSHKNEDHSSQLRSDPPPPALQNAPTSDVFFPHDDYPPGFPCTSGCGKKFSTVIQLEIHIQHYCEGPYDEIEAWQGASVAAPQTPSASSVSDHDRIVRWLASSDASTLEPDLPASPSYDASAIEDDEDFAAVISHLDPKLLLNPTVDVGAVSHREGFAWGISNLEHPLSNPPVDAVAVNHHEGFTSGTSRLERDLPASPSYNAIAVDDDEDFAAGISYLDPKVLLKPTVDAVTVNHIEGFASGTSHLEHPPSGPTVDAVTVNQNEVFALGTRHVESSLPSTPTVDAVAGNHKEGFNCPLCGKYLNRRGDLNRHMKVHASGQINCLVDGCNYHTAKSQAELDFHVRVNHADITEQGGGVRFTCWHCGRHMGRRRPLIAHVKLHESGYKFPCPIDNCSSPALWDQVALDRHLKNKHTDAEISGSFL